MLAAQAQAPWSTASHSTFAEPQRRAAMACLLVAGRLAGAGPPPQNWLLVLAYAVTRGGRPAGQVKRLRPRPALVVRAEDAKAATKDSKWASAAHTYIFPILAEAIGTEPQRDAGWHGG